VNEYVTDPLPPGLTVIVDGVIPGADSPCSDRTVSEHVAVTAVTPVPEACIVTVVVPAAAPAVAVNVTVPELLTPGCS
jgi:hypothetical protein